MITLRPQEADKTSTSTSAEPRGNLWNRFWFAEMPAFNFALFRTILGLLALIWFVTLIPDFNVFFGDGSLAIDRVPGRGTFTIFSLFESEIFLWVGLALGHLASLSLLFGKLTRLGGPVLAVIIASVMAENRMLWNAGDDLLQTFALLFGIYCLLTPSSDLDTSLRIAPTTSLATGRLWLFQLIKIQMTVVYLIAFLAKIPGSMWRDGTATMVVFRLETMERFYTPAWLETNFVVGNITTWSALALEGALPFLLWNRKTRPYAIGAAVIFHIAIDWSLYIGLFSWIMILGLTAFLGPSFAVHAQTAKNKLIRGI